MPHDEITRLRYVLITPARNEAAFIEQAIHSVVNQTVLPIKWVIVSDGSTDGTNEIVIRYTSRYDWIELVSMPAREGRHFDGKVRAFDAGYARVRHLNYEIIGNLDGDASFDPDYISYLLSQFAQNPQLGVAGTNYWESSWEKNVKHDYRFSNNEDVSGLCQLFRRECFEAIGGYEPSRQGGVDLIASIEARMHGWQTRTFNDRIAIHHRQQGTAEAHKLLVEFYNGQKDFVFGSHPLWEVLRATYRLVKKPYIIGGCFILTGYFWAMMSRAQKTISPDMMQFRRKEQMKRLREMCVRFVGWGETIRTSERVGVNLKAYGGMHSDDPGIRSAGGYNSSPPTSL
jgi:poly-beta-1,6-N-acetyl-D-glucosamine synthase